MPKSKGTKYYAVLIGRGGPHVYDNWDDCKSKVSRFPGAVHKSFRSIQEAENWLGSQPVSALANSAHLDSGSWKATHHPEATLFDNDNQNPSCCEGNTSFPLSDIPPSVSLSTEQKKVFEHIKAGKNVFFTGSAGTGKSVLLREIINLRGGHSSEILAITASTGIAAVNIGGTTLHSWAGIGIGHESSKQLIGKFFGQPKYYEVRKRWQSVETLIIDEVSMLDGNLFDKLESVAQGMRRNERPFGGIQLVLCGDFCQLPPVGGRDEKGEEIPVTFAFEAESWNRCVGSRMTLTRVFRQKDQRFVDMLNEMRFGEMAAHTVEAFRNLSRKVHYTDGIEPTELFSTRAEVNYANQSRLRQLPGGYETYHAHDTPGKDGNGQRVTPAKMEQLLERLICPKLIQLKVGAQVMLIKNLVQRELVNGSVGQIIAFQSATDAQKDQTDIAKVENESSDARIAPNPTLWPVVRFIGGKERVILPADFTINNADGGMEARRIQIPLILAWALSVHKSQGQTLERVRVDLRRTFEKGQAYVALSRATTMDQLQVINFDPAKVVAHPRVLAWYGVSTPTASSQDDFDEMDNEEAMSAYYNL